MSVIEAPKITDAPAKADSFTKITFEPDLAKFQMTCLDDDTIAVLEKRVYDMAGVVDNVKVYLNNERIKIRTFKDYVQYYIPSAETENEENNHEDDEEEAKKKRKIKKKKENVIHNIVYGRPNERWEIAFTQSEGQFQQVTKFLYFSVSHFAR